MALLQTYLALPTVHSVQLKAAVRPQRDASWAKKYCSAQLIDGGIESLFKKIFLFAGISGTSEPKLDPSEVLERSRALPMPVAR